MLNKLSYSVEFPSTGRRFENSLQFEPGLTAVTGRNEAGKSLIVEMIGYCLFGKSALRGAASDYKNLSASLELVVGGKTFTIERLPKHEELAIDGEIIAIGADAINKTVPQLLGFGLAVFNIAQVAQQDSLNEFTNMRPTARAKMVDDLTGMDALEVTERDCKQEAKQHMLLADALTIDLRIPVEPEPITDTRSVEELDALIETLSAQQMERNMLTGLLPPQEPVEPVAPDIDMSEEELVSYEDTRRSRLLQQDMWIKALAQIPEPQGSLQDLKRAEAAFEYREELRRRGPQPSHDRQTLLDWEKVWLTPTQGTCPECGYDFRDRTIEVPPLTLAQVRAELSKAERWAEPLQEVEYIGPVTDIERERQAHSRTQERTGLRRDLEALTIPASRADDLDRVRKYNRDRHYFEAEKESFDKAQVLYAEAQLKLSQLPDQSRELNELREARILRMQYDSALVRYESEKEQYERGLDTAKAQREEADGFTNAARALKLTRTQVKQELAPSISKAASALLYSLTNGERQTIVVDYDFNVWVDNQPLATLSGSGKAVVNLALRIGLGQVLTAKVLSLFIGDEIDGSMDQTRAEATHGTFRNLTKHISQVILITHKAIEADHHIRI